MKSQAFHGYRRVCLDLNGKVCTRTVHVLVLLAFIGPCPEGMEGCHYPDTNKANNRLSNLRWDTHAENMKDKYRDKPAVMKKACKRCGIVKPLSDYYNDARAIDGRKPECKICHQQINLATRAPEKKRRHNREWAARWRARCKAL